MNRFLCALSIFLLSFSGIFAQVKVGAEDMSSLLPLLKGKKVGLVVNHTSIIGKNQVHLLDTLLSAGVNVCKIYAPEHGFRGTADAGEKIKDGKDLKTGLPIVSIYGANRKPTPEQLKDIDVIIFDIQDVGARFYTYISTMHYLMEACAENNKHLIIGDRPNPNDYVDGPVMQDDCKSFVGMHSIPILHGLTVGELALMINGEKWLKNGIKCSLDIVKNQGWKHGDKYVLPVKPSPNLPNEQSILLYPSLCFFEATNISVGRGTTYPFQVLGAPDPKYGKFTFTPVSLEGWDKNPLNMNKKCYGVDLRNIPFQGGLSLKFFIDFMKLSGDNEKFITRGRWFELLAGNKILAKQITSGMSEQAIRASWEQELSKYKKMREKYLLYLQL